MEYDLEHPPWATAEFGGDSDKWGDEQDRSEWFQAAAEYWCRRAIAAEQAPKPALTLDDLKANIDAVLAYNWPSEFTDAKENGLEGHVMTNLIALAAFNGTPISDESMTELTSEGD